MATLYEILGVDKLATSAQIELGYKQSLRKLTESAEHDDSEEGLLHVRVLKEAYTVLSSPSRRQNYDEKLGGTHSVRADDRSSFPWIKMTLFAAVLIAGGLAYHRVQLNNQRIEQEAAQAKAAKEQAEKEALAAKQRLEEEKQLAEARRWETEQIRRDSQLSHEKYVQFQAQAKRDKEMEERMAIRKSQEQTEAWKRALAIPIRRH
ncbi:MAG: DnaJ domain-containing protein [Pseudomonadota bacterium]